MDDAQTRARRQQATGPRQLWWSRWLTAHLLVAVLVTLLPWALLGADADGPGAAAGQALGLVALLLGLPWSGLALVVTLPPGSPDAETQVGLLVASSVLLNVAVHWCVLVVGRSRRVRTAGSASAPPGAGAP